MSKKKVQPGDLFICTNNSKIWFIVERYYFGAEPPEKQTRRWTMRSLDDFSKAIWIEEARLLGGWTWKRL